MLNHDDIYAQGMADKDGLMVTCDLRTKQYSIVFAKQNVWAEFHNLFKAAPTMYVMLDNQYQALKKLEEAYTKKGLLREAAEFQNLAESLRITMLLATKGLDNAAGELQQHQKLKATKIPETAKPN